MRSRVFIALIHYPVYNRRGEVIATSITNLDLHDLARVAATYGVEKYFVVHPLESQRQLAEEVLHYWKQGFGAQYNPNRREAFLGVEVVAALEEAQRRVEDFCGERPYVVATGARAPWNIDYLSLRKEIEEKEGAFLVLFGTGWGLAREIMENADLVLKPIEGEARYNHLSVRSAVSIVLDRLLGEKWWLIR